MAVPIPVAPANCGPEAVHVIENRARPDDSESALDRAIGADVNPSVALC
jgi:hypothetical protein